MIKDGINNSTNYQPWISYVSSENLVFNQFVDILFFFFIVLICMAGNVMKLKVEINKILFVTSESERVNCEFWSPGKNQSE